VAELEGAVADLEVKVAAGLSMAQDMETKKAALELQRQEAGAAYKLDKDKLLAERTQLQVGGVAARGVSVWGGVASQ
jgi:hypothetical protein